jgi:hypothetical protein
LDKGLRNFIAEVVIATAVTALLALTRGYGSLFMQVLPFLYIIVLFEIAARYAYAHKINPT